MIRIQRSLVGRRKVRRLVALALCCAALVACWPAGAWGQGAKVGYNREIRPLLAENCFACHGPDKNNRKGKLRLDDRAAAIDRGALVPGQPEKSELIARIASTESTELMPPPSSHKTLSASQKELLKRWIAQGAEYEPYWAYVPPTRPAVPVLAGAKTPIDAFVRQRLEEKKISPSPEADRRTLLRRLSLDLIGLPPSVEEVEAFVRDSDPRAYEKQVDRLLASKHFGERWAAPWLDAVRFADTVGFHGDQNQRIFPYRDYVIDSFNANKPFDQFTIEQLAGDLLPNPTTEQRVATGFNRLNMMTREGGAQAKEYLARYAADRVRTIGTAWLGATLGCCECHEHKFDPYTLKDFYRMAAFFADVKQWGIYADYSYTPNPDLRGWSNDHPFPPEIRVDSAALQRRIADLQARLQTLAANSRPTAEAERAAFSQWMEETNRFLTANPLGSKPLAAIEAVETSDDGAALLPANRKDATFETKLDAGRVTVLTVDLLPHAKTNNKIVRRKAGTLSLSATLLRGKEKIPLSFRWAEADARDPMYVNGEDVLGILRGWRLPAGSLDRPHRAGWLLTKPMPIKAGDVLRVKLSGTEADYVRVSWSPLATLRPQSNDWADSIRRALTEASQPKNQALLRGEYLMSTAWNPVAFDAAAALENRIHECREGKTWSLVTEAVAKPAVVRVLPRGNWQSENGEIVQPGVPHFLPQIKDGETRRLNRLDLAKWLVAPENPLTARVIMNRLWKDMLGRGISGRLDDLGGMGEWPTHPELLDWLAVEFRESGWNFKHMVKTIAMSDTYRQSSNLRPELRDVDPDNRLLASQNPRRLDAEFVRDNVLSISGLLNREYGGPSAFPYQPPFYYSNIQFPNREYVPSRDERQYRRGVYMHWQRTFVHPMLANFDAPTREDCIAARSVANTPQQALTMLNDPTFVEAARVLAAHVMTSKTTDSERIDLIFLQSLARLPKETERSSLRDFLQRERHHYRAHPAEAAKLLAVGIAPNPTGLDSMEQAAWTNVCRTILNLHEVITRY